MPNNLVLPLEDYQQIYQTVYSIVEFEMHDVKGMCYPFNFLGAGILSKAYSLNARVACGGASINLGSNNILTTGQIQNNSILSSPQEFHCWVIVNDSIIDFRSPLFESIAKLKGLNHSIPPKMFQKEISSMSSSPNSLINPGDFYYEENLSLTDHMINLNTNKLSDYLLNCCLDWYSIPITDMKKSFRLLDKRGISQKIKLNYTIIKDAW